MEKSANGILKTTIEKVRDLVDVSTIIGEPIKISETLQIIPVSKVTYGFASGGTDFPSKSNAELFGGGGGETGGGVGGSFFHQKSILLHGQGLPCNELIYEGVEISHGRLPSRWSRRS